MAKRDLSGAVDFPRLELYAGGDAALVEEVLALFQEQADLWLRLLEGGGGGGSGFRDAAHALKGSALGLCADSLADACGRAEAQADAPHGLQAVLAARVRDEADRVLADAAAWRHEQALRSLRGPAQG